MLYKQCYYIKIYVAKADNLRQFCFVTFYLHYLLPITFLSFMQCFVRVLDFTFMYK